MKLSSMDLDRLLIMSPAEKWDFVCGALRDEGKSGEVALLLGTEPVEARRRAKTAAQLYLAGRVRYVIPSGGVLWNFEGEKLSEATWMTRILLEEGVPREAILADEIARTTVENMIGGSLVIARSLKIKNVRHLILVTSLFHMQRSLALAKALLPRKIEISVCPCLPEEGREAWLASEKNQTALDQAIRLLYGLVKNGVVEDFDLP